MNDGPDSTWLAQLRERLARPPRQPRVPLAMQAPDAAQGVVIGSVEHAFLQPFADLRAAGGGPLMQARAAGGWVLQGEPTPALAALAQALRAAGQAGAWRDEALAVTDAQGAVRATVERGVARVLGIATHAVHLVGVAGWQTPARARGVWVQQRSVRKANDPGHWDTLVGGMVAASDDAHSALLRESWEEAGLRPVALEDLCAGGRIDVRRPSADGGAGAAYMIERIDWSWATLADGAAPVNQDGEVERFECLQRAELLRRLQADAFTDEAALILVQALPALGWAGA